MDIPEDWEVLILQNGTSYHKCDDGMIFKSFLSMAGTAFENEAVPVSEIEGYAGKAVSITHRQFSEMMGIAYQLFSREDV